MSPKLLNCFCFWALMGLCAALSSACGYHSVYAPPRGVHLSVHVGEVLVPEALAVQATLSGARAELATAGSLAGEGTSSRLVIDVLRIDETSRGLYVRGGQPHAAGMSLAVTVRGRVFSGSEREPELDTGDLRRAVQVAGEVEPRADAVAREAAIRAAAERAGKAIARYVLGIPEIADEGP